MFSLSSNLYIPTLGHGTHRTKYSKTKNNRNISPKQETMKNLFNFLLLSPIYTLAHKIRIQIKFIRQIFHHINPSQEKQRRQTRKISCVPVSKFMSIEKSIKFSTPTDNKSYTTFIIFGTIIRILENILIQMKPESDGL